MIVISDTRKQGFWLGVIASLVASLIFEFLTKYKPWTFVFGLVKKVYEAVNWQITIPVWALIIVLFSIPVLKKTVNIFNKYSWKNYKSDMIFDIYWEWDWFLGSIRDLIPLCPNCKNQLIPYMGNYKAVGDCILCCENCSYRKHFDDN